MLKTRYRTKTRKVCKGPKIASWRSRKKRGAGSKLQIMYDKQIVADQRLTRAITSDIPEVMFGIQENKQYTLVMYDVDSPNPAYIHWLQTNITNHAKGLTVLPYEAPNPPTHDKHYHAYMFELLEQSGPLRIDYIQRSGNSIDVFKKHHGLRSIASCGFYIDPQL